VDGKGWGNYRCGYGFTIRWWIEDGAAAVENMLIAARFRIWLMLVGGYTLQREFEFKALLNILIICAASLVPIGVAVGGRQSVLWKMLFIGKLSELTG
jgi:hypothetical protein